MSQLDGLFSLRAPADLLAELESDHARLKQAEPTSTSAQYAAFDFFVTAHHLADWCAKSFGGSLTQWRSYPDGQVLGHVANGVKHFRVDKYDVVKETEVVPGAFGVGAFQSSAFQTGKLTIHLENGESEPVLPLADRVLAHWRATVAAAQPAT